MADNNVILFEGNTLVLPGMTNMFMALVPQFASVDINMTINKKYGVLGSHVPTPYRPELLYFGIGINGFYNTDDSTGAAPHQPYGTDFDLYTPLPIRVVPVTNDLSVSERAKYRMRVVRDIDGTAYACYYLKLIEWGSSPVKRYRRDPSGIEEEFSIDPNWLYPEPPLVSEGNIIDENTARMIVRMEGNMTLSGLEINEAINSLYGGDPTHTMISEYGLYTGMEVYTDINGTLSEIPTAYKEAAVTQLLHHCTLRDGNGLTNEENEVTRTVRLGHTQRIYMQ